MKNNRLWLLLLLVLPIFLLAGCSGKNVADQGFKNPEQAVSIPSLLEMENRGVEFVLFFPVIVESGIARIEGFLHSVETADGSRKMVNDGVFPLLAIKKDDSISKENGFYFLTSMNVFGDNFALAIIAGKKEDFKKIFSLSRDGHLAADVMGNSLVYDSENFSDDKNYRLKISEAGHSPVEIEQSFRKYYAERGIDIPERDSLVMEIKVGSPEWKDLRNMVTDRLSFGYRTMEGEARQGYLSKDEFKKEYSKNNGTTSVQRFFKNFNFAVTGEVNSSLLLTGGSAINAMIQATSGSPDGLYSSTVCKRGDLREQFASMHQEKQELIRRLHATLWNNREEIEKLRETIRRLGGTP